MCSLKLVESFVKLGESFFWWYSDDDIGIVVKLESFLAVSDDGGGSCEERSRERYGRTSISNLLQSLRFATLGRVPWLSGDSLVDLQCESSEHPATADHPDPATQVEPVSVRSGLNDTTSAGSTDLSASGVTARPGKSR